MKLSRREMSIGVGLTLLLGPSLAAIREREALASVPTKKAKRLLVMFTPNGTVPGRYWPTGSGTSFSFAPGSILEPLAPIQGDVAILKGLKFDGFDNHEAGMHGMLTGSPSSGMFGGASVDQYIAKQLPQTSAFRSVELGVMTDPWGASEQTRMDYSGQSTFVNPEQNPQAAFKRLFASVAGAGTGAGSAGGGAAADAIASRRRSILDFLRGDIASLSGQLGASERHKLDAHLTSIRAVESSLFPPASGPVAASCTAATSPAAMDPNSQPNFPALGKAQMDLALLALQCNLSPIVSLQWSHTVSPVVFSWLGLTAGHHDLSHAQNDDFVKAERWFAQQFVYLVQELKTRGLLADTLVVWAKELGDSSLHNAIDVPFVLAGNAGGALQTGRLMNFGGVSHQGLLASIVQGMGIDTASLGANAGGLPGLLA
jgi:hypothetical protein